MKQKKKSRKRIFGNFLLSMHVAYGWLCIDNLYSERHGKGESNEDVAHKARYALDKGLSVMACCGKPKELQDFHIFNTSAKKVDFIRINKNDRIYINSSNTNFMHILWLFSFQKHYDYFFSKHFNKLILKLFLSICFLKFRLNHVYISIHSFRIISEIF